MFLSKGTLNLSLALAFTASAAIGTVSAVDVDPLIASYEPYATGGKQNLVISYSDESGHNNIVNRVATMKGKGKKVKESTNHKLNKTRKLKKEKGAGTKKGKSDKDRRLRWLQEDGAIMAGFSVLELETDDIKAEIAALSAIDGVTAVEQDVMMHINTMEYQQKLRGGAADHIREIQDAISATADELPEEDAEALHGRRLAEQTPYGIDMVNASHVWPETPVANIKICVVDTGYDITHEDLPTDGVAGFDQYGQSWSVDGHGHGTHCAGTIGAIGGNGKGVTSVNPDPSKFTFFIGKGLSNSGSGSGTGVMAAVAACVEAGAKVISMSLGGGGYSSVTNGLYEDYYDDNVLIIAAAGNGGNSALGFPASYPAVVSVASLTSDGSRSGFSQYNDQVEIAAPGSAVLSTLPTGNNYAAWSGTSMACPHVAGVAALLWSHFPDCTNNQIRNAMINSSVESGSAGWDKYYGWGRVNAGNAYELLKNGCEVAGGPISDPLSDLALGGKNQGVPQTPTPAPTPLPPCTGTQQRFEVQIQTDNYPGETTWTLTDKCNTSIGQMMSGGPYSASNAPYSDMSDCADDGQYEFQINDSYGDGICCGYGSGSYLVKFGTVEKTSGGQFAFSETKTFGTCGSTPPPTTGSTPPPTTGSTPPPTTGSTPPPSAPPTNPPTAPPTNPPTAPPTNPPTNPPTAPPTNPPTNPPTAPPTNPPTSPPVAPPTPSPTTGGGAVAQGAIFDSSYGVPKCANMGSSCDSLGLLNGRGTISNGNEPNRSNTNNNGNTCNDGNYGSYHSDESIDQITVTAGDIVSGTPVPSGDFITEGGRAYVTVKLWCWGSGASDTADIYLTKDASSPDWEPLASITCPGGGAQTIVQAFDVPKGTNQSIRVNFRWGGSASTCSSGGYDDHDDLIFTVKENPNFTPSPTPAPTQPPTPVPTPVPTPMPTDANDGPPPSPGGVASYDAGLGAPKCSFASSCDSGGLLNGRANINNGAEPNQPNTLNTCTDGPAGSYHSDESIDKIVVSKESGGDLTEGDLVTITATIWCWGSGTSDRIDFYYAANANQPAWTQIGLRQVCPGPGLQTVTKEFVLPQGSTQAVRVNLMYGSGSAGVNSCTSGSWDDTDDLVISVRPNPSIQGLVASPGKSKHDDVQGTIVYAAKDAAADMMEKELQELNQSTEKPTEDDDGNEGGKGKGKKGKADKGGVSVETASATAKYVCTKHRPLTANICDEGSPADGTCTSEGQRCGRKGRKCWFADCDGNEEANE